ncbi:hypothetical protein [Nonomuraea fuscirosea]|uniref:hypothetical protein n=1 Tax=Nonomuraea fuscirosea TaxID=1291556 RepID=UPI0033CF0554
MKSKIAHAEAAGCARLFSLRHDFPVAWASYKNAPAVAGAFRPITIELTPPHYPFWSRTKQGERGVTSAMLIARGTGTLQVAKPDGTSQV